MRHNVSLQTSNYGFQGLSSPPFTLSFLRLLDDSLNNLKIADFGLSEFYRPGGTLSSAIGTLSFQAPEMFSNTNYAGDNLSDLQSCAEIYDF